MYTIIRYKELVEFSYDEFKEDLSHDAWNRVYENSVQHSLFIYIIFFGITTAYNKQK